MSQVPMYRSEALWSLLKDLRDGQEGVHAAVLLSIEGLLVEAYPSDESEDSHVNPTSSPQVAAMASVMAGLSRRTLDRLAQGDLERLLVQGEHGVLIIYPCGRNFLAVLVEIGVRLGPVITAMNDTTPRVLEILES
ncbi:MAG: roadblock/LC7 domain-containing protein [Anaerolineae bacterium]|nr:roadblock/LC7 domain-containing protein [Anaerolineae bacterium]